MLHVCKIFAAVLTLIRSSQSATITIGDCERIAQMASVSKHFAKFRNCHRRFVTSFISRVQWQIWYRSKFMLLSSVNDLCVYVSERFVIVFVGNVCVGCLFLFYMMSVKPSPSCLLFYLLPIVFIVIVFVAFTISSLQSFMGRMLLLLLLYFI